MMYLGDKAVGLGANSNKEVLLYKDDTLGNEWTSCELADVDYENNALVLQEEPNLPLNELTALNTARLVIKPSLQVKYKEIFNDLCGYTISFPERVKYLGNNKVQFCNDAGNVISIGINNDVVLNRMLFMYRNTNTHYNKNILDNIPPKHMIHVRWRCYGPSGGTMGIAGLDSNGVVISNVAYTSFDPGIDGSGYLNGGQRRNIYSFSCFDSYGNIVGFRTLSGYNYTTLIGNTFALFEFWFYPETLLGGDRIFAQGETFTFEQNQPDGYIRLNHAETHYLTTRNIAKLEFRANNGYDSIGGPGSTIEVFDCGPVL